MCLIITNPKNHVSFFYDQWMIKKNLIFSAYDKQCIFDNQFLHVRRLFIIEKRNTACWIRHEMHQMTAFLCLYHQYMKNYLHFMFQKLFTIFSSSIDPRDMRTPPLNTSRYDEPNKQHFTPFYDHLIFISNYLNLYYVILKILI